MSQFDASTPAASTATKNQINCAKNRTGTQACGCGAGYCYADDPASNHNRAYQPVAAAPAAQAIKLSQKHEATLAKAAAVVRARGHEGDARLADSIQGVIASLKQPRAVLQQRQAPAQASMPEKMPDAVEEAIMAVLYGGVTRGEGPAHIYKAIHAALAQQAEAAPVASHDSEQQAANWLVKHTNLSAESAAKAAAGLRPLFASQAAPVASAEPVGEIVIFGTDLKEVSWTKGKMPPPGTKLYGVAQAAPAPADDEWDRNAERLTREMGLGGGKIKPGATSILDIFVDDDAPAPEAAAPGLVEVVNAVQMVRQYPAMDFIERNKLLDLAIDRLASLLAAPVASQPAQSEQQLLGLARRAGMDVVGDYINPERTVRHMTSAVLAFGKLVAGRASQPAGGGEAKDAARYRWLCENNFDRQSVQVHTWHHWYEPHSQTGEPTEWKARVRGGALDQIIDAAMAATPSTQQENDK